MIFDIPELGTEWVRSSLVWGRFTGTGTVTTQTSPVGNRVIQRFSLLSEEELETLVGVPTVQEPLSSEELRALCARLHTALEALREPLLEAMRWETGFILRDCEEMLEGSLEYVRDFPHQADPPSTPGLKYAMNGQFRQIRLVSRPWGTILVILPQNAFLILALTCLLNALAMGNRVIVRAPVGSARSAGLLAQALERVLSGRTDVSVVLTRAQDMIKAVCESPQPALVHYLGSTRHVASILSEAFRNSKSALIDGEGNGWVWVDADVRLEEAADLLVAGAIRYNGQTCTSINGALIHPANYEAIRACLIERWRTLRAGNPMEEDVDVGPLFDKKQAEWCEERIRKSEVTILSGGRREENLLTPTLIERPLPNIALVTEGLFAPTLWIAPATRQGAALWWQSNQYPLCMGVLSENPEPDWWLDHLPDLARLVVNGDPSLEYIFEPWGGYPASGNNPVSRWHEKYRRIVQLDLRA